MTSRGRRARAIGGLALLVMLAALVVRVVSSSPTESATATDRPELVTTKCADLIVLGARGSGQSPTHNSGVGQEVLRSVRAMVPQMSGGTVRLEAVDYPSSRAATYEAYLAGVKEGGRTLGSQFAQLSKDCPHSRFAFIGFSHGAHVVHEFAHDLPLARARRVALVAMIADPWRNPDDTIAAWAYDRKPATHAGRLGAGPVFDAATREAAITLCVSGDEVCNRPNDDAPGELSDTHRHFYEKPANVRSTGAQLAAVLRRNGFP
jgi:cutinase